MLKLNRIIITLDGRMCKTYKESKGWTTHICFKPFKNPFSGLFSDKMIKISCYCVVYSLLGSVSAVYFPVIGIYMASEGLYTAHENKHLIVLLASYVMLVH